MNPPEEPRKEKGDSTMLMETRPLEVTERYGKKARKELVGSTMLNIFDSRMGLKDAVDSNIGRHGSIVSLESTTVDRSNSSSPAGRRVRLRSVPLRSEICTGSSLVNSGRHGSKMPPEFTSIILDEIMTALAQQNIGILGIYGSSNANKENVVDKVTKRVQRDGLFNVVVKTSVTKKPDLKRIQGELGNALGLQLHQKTLKERATRLCERIKMEDHILIILDDLQAQIDLAEIGIPFGNDHKGCKILLVAENKEMLSHKMKTQKQISVDEVEPSSSGTV